eukprot:UN11269
MESDHSDQWELLFESSTTDSFHLTSPIKQISDDNVSVQSLDSSQSQSSSVIIVNAVPLQQPSSLIPQIDENKQINNNNELIPSYIDIQSELQKQRDVINELQSQLNDVENERDQVREERDDLKERLRNNSLELMRLTAINNEIERQDISLRGMTRKYHVRGRKLKKIQSKTVSITNKRGHRPTVPAKLRFRRQRTTHRTGVFAIQALVKR